MQICNLMLVKMPLFVLLIILLSDDENKIQRTKKPHLCFVLRYFLSVIVDFLSSHQRSRATTVLPDNLVTSRSATLSRTRMRTSLVKWRTSTRSTSNSQCCPVWSCSMQSDWFDCGAAGSCFTMWLWVCCCVPRGLKQSDAELCFLNTARTLELYGVELHAAMVPVFMTHTVTHCYQHVVSAMSDGGLSTSLSLPLPSFSLSSFPPSSLPGHQQRSSNGGLGLQWCCHIL